MVTHVQSDAKRAGETLKYDFNFAPDMADGTVISSFTVSGDGVTVGAGSEAASVVTVDVSGGTAGTKAKVLVAATISNGEVLEIETLLRIT